MKRKSGLLRGLIITLCLLPALAGGGEEPPEAEVEIAPPPVIVEPESEAAPIDPVVDNAIEAPPPAVVAHHFPPYKVKYNVNYSGIKVGEMTQQLTAKANGRQTMQTVAYTTGLVSWLKSDKATERSIWLEEGGTLLPLSYTYRYSGNNKEVFERLDFDWQTGIVKSLRDDKITELTVERGTADKQLYQLLLRRDLATGMRPLNYPVAERGKLEQYNFEVLGEEELESDALGKVHCLKLKRDATLIWLAPKYDYLPVKIEKDEDGSLVSSELVEFSRR